MTRIKKPLEGDFQNILTLFLFIGILLNTLFVFESKALYLITFIFVFFIFLKFTSINLQRILFVFNSLNIFTLIIRIDPFSTSAQNVYYPKILSSLNFGNVSNFWLVEIDDPYPAFSLVNRFLITYFGIDSINILLFILYFLFIFTIYKLCDFINKPNSDLIGFVTSLVFIVLIIGDNIPTSYIISDGIVGNLASQTLGVSNVLLDGLSSYTEFSSRRALIPASFNILILLTIYFFMIKKYLLGFLFGVFISLFHYFSFINLFLVIVSLIFTLLFKKKNKFFYPITFLSIALSTYLASRIFYFLPISKNIIETLEVLYLRNSPEWILKPIVSLGSFTGANIENRYLYFQFDLVERSFIKNFEDVNYINPTPGAFDNYSIFPFEFLIMTIVGFFISKK